MTPYEALCVDIALVRRGTCHQRTSSIHSWFSSATAPSTHLSTSTGSSQSWNSPDNIRVYSPTLSGMMKTGTAGTPFAGTSWRDCNNHKVCAFIHSLNQPNCLHSNFLPNIPFGQVNMHHYIARPCYVIQKCISSQFL